MDTLEACLTPNAVREALVSLPRDLPKTYDRMMESIPPQYKDDSIRLLQFIVNCQQPLIPAEAVEILATRPDRHQNRLRFDPEDRLFNSSHIERYCPGMIHIVPVTDEDPDKDDHIHRWEEVHLTHFSVKEYLTKIDTFCELDSAIVITETLINYLYDVKGPLYRVRADFPLAIRAENIWCEFARRAQTVEKIVQMTAKLLFSRSNVLKHYRISQQPAVDWYCSSGRRSKRLYKTLWYHDRAEDGFSKACLGGLHSTVAYMMEDPEFNVPAEDKEVYLMQAIFNQYPEVAEVLLEYGASPDASHSDGSAVYQASRWGFDRLVRKLIKAGADLSGDTLDLFGNLTSALCAASENGHLEIVQDLLKAGHHVRIQDALQRAVGNGHDAIVELLIDWGACEAEPIHDHVLEMAAFRGTIQLVCRLLDARPDGYDKNKLNNALSRACEAGRVDIVRLLVSRGAQADRSINFQYEDSKYDDKSAFKHGFRIHHIKSQNCLVLAAQSGNEDVVNMLLDEEFNLSQVLDLNKELEVNTSIYVGEAFVMALLGCHQSVIITLLDAMVNHAHTDEIAALRAASEDENQHILRGFSDAMEHDMKRRKFPDFPWVVEQLHKLLLGHHKHILQALLKEAGIDYLARDPNSEDLLLPLEVAAHVGSVAAVAQFIQAGVDLNIGKPLYYAVVNGHEHVVRLLLDRGANANLIAAKLYSDLDYPLLFHACSAKRTVVSDSIAYTLLDHGADYNYVDHWGNTALHLAAGTGRVGVVERLLNLGSGVCKMDKEDRTPLQVASNTDTIRVLLLAGSNANARADTGWTPLHNAASQGNPDGIELLLRYRAKVNVPTEDGRTALHTALRARIAFDQNILQVAKLLLEKGADINAVDNEGMSPFQMATGPDLSQATVDIISMLIAHGANVNSQNNYGSTALHEVEDSVEWADLLLDHGVTIDARDGKGRTALFSAFQGTVGREILTRFGDETFALRDPLKPGYLDVARFLIERGADVKILTKRGETMLHAMNLNTLSLCPILLERGVPINALTTEGWSPIAFTLSRISKIRERNLNRETEYYFVKLALSEIQAMREVIKLLVEKGGKNIRNWQEEEYSLEE